MVSKAKSIQELRDSISKLRGGRSEYSTYQKVDLSDSLAKWAISMLPKRFSCISLSLGYDPTNDSLDLVVRVRDSLLDRNIILPIDEVVITKSNVIELQDAINARCIPRSYRNRLRNLVKFLTQQGVHNARGT